MRIIIIIGCKNWPLSAFETPITRTTVLLLRSGPSTDLCRWSHRLTQFPPPPNFNPSTTPKEVDGKEQFHLIPGLMSCRA